MICRIADAAALPEGVAATVYGRRFRALRSAYGTGYDFCRFYELLSGRAYAAVLNASMTLCAGDAVDFEELSAFMALNGIQTAEMPLALGEAFAPAGYKKIPRILFEFQAGEFPAGMLVEEAPPLDEVFAVLRTGFPLDKAYALWLTDASHQIRHGISRAYLYKGTTATMHSCMDGIAFFGQIATLPGNRGKGHARELLYWLEARMAEQGVKAWLFARPERVCFYRGLGFKEIGTDFIFEKEII